MLVSLLSSMCTPLSCQEEEDFPLVEKRYMGLHGDQHVALLPPPPALTMEGLRRPITQYNTEMYIVTFTPQILGFLGFLNIVYKISILPDHSGKKWLVKAPKLLIRSSVQKVQRPELAHFTVYFKVFGGVLWSFWR